MSFPHRLCVKKGAALTSTFAWFVKGMHSVILIRLVQAAKYTVPIEIVSAISQRTHAVVQLPREIGQVLEQHLGPGSKKGLRADSQALLQELRTRSRSVARGGSNYLPALKVLQEAGEQDRPKQKVLSSL